MNKEFLARMRDVMSAKLFNIGTTPISLSTLTTMLLVIVAAYTASRILQSAMVRGLKRRGVDVDKGGLGALGRLLHYTLMLVGIGVALQTGGIQLSALFAAGAVFAVGIGFAMQNIAQNFVSGVILLVERTIKPGDILEVDGDMVRVVMMGIRTTAVRTQDEEELIVPNSVLVQGPIKHFSLGDPLYRLRAVVGVVYGANMDQVQQTLTQVAMDFPARAADRDPAVILLDFGASSVDWEVSVWIMDPWNRRPLTGELRKSIWDALKREKISIAFPQVDVHFDPPVMESLRGLSGARAAQPPS
jgi:small-conductance mechanosensitive channel